MATEKERGAHGGLDSRPCTAYCVFHRSDEPGRKKPIMSAPEIRAAAYAADDAYATELRRIFGKAAGDARYDARGKSTPELRRLSDVKLAADAAMRGES